MNPVCVNCRNVMRIVKNGVTVSQNSNHAHQYSGDKYWCNKCGVTVVMGFGNPFHNPDVSPDIILQ